MHPILPYLIIEIILRKPKKYLLDLLSLKSRFLHKTYQVFFTFALVTFAWIFFRANTITDAFYVINNMFVDIEGYTDFTKMKLSLRGLGVNLNQILISIGLILFMECYNFTFFTFLLYQICFQ